MSNYKLKAKNKATGKIMEFSAIDNVSSYSYVSEDYNVTFTATGFNELFEVVEDVSDTCKEHDKVLHDEWIEEFDTRFKVRHTDPYNRIIDCNFTIDEIKDFIAKQKQDIIKIIEDEPTEFPVRESDEFDAGGRAFKQALLSKIK